MTFQGLSVAPGPKFVPVFLSEKQDNDSTHPQHMMKLGPCEPSIKTGLTTGAPRPQAHCCLSCPLSALCDHLPHVHAFPTRLSPHTLTHPAEGMSLTWPAALQPPWRQPALPGPALASSPAALLSRTGLVSVSAASEDSSLTSLANLTPCLGWECSSGGLLSQLDPQDVSLSPCTLGPPKPRVSVVVRLGGWPTAEGSPQGAPRQPSAHVPRI